MYKLVAIDMDGTLLRKDHTISDYNKKILDQVRAKGVRIVLASGRPLAGLMPYIKELDMISDDDYVICFNGALVQNIATQEIVGRTVLKGKDLSYLYEMSQKLGVNIHAFATKGCITPKISQYTEFECEINKISVDIVDFSDVDPAEDIIKIMMIDDQSILQPAIDSLPQV